MTGRNWVSRSACAAGAIVTLMLASCGSEPASQSDAKQVAEDIRAAAGGDATCPLSASEVSGLLAAKVDDAVTIGAGCAYNYAGTDEFAATMEIASTEAGYGPGGAKPDEYAELAGIGEAAWIGRGYQKSWRAQARKGDKFVNVSVGGKAGSRDVAIVVLKAALAKL